MTAVALTAVKIGAVKAIDAEIIDVIAGVTVTAGQVVKLDTAGKLAIANATGAGTADARGIALKGGLAGDVVPILKRGHCEGFTVSGINGDAELYLSDTAGVVADAAGTVSRVLGRVVCLTDSALTKLCFFDIDWRQI